MSGLLDKEIGRIVWLELARNIVYGLTSLRQVVKEGTGEWDKQYKVDPVIRTE